MSVRPREVHMTERATVLETVETPETAPTTAHDPQTPPALVEFMCRDWATPPRDGTKPIDGARFFHARRRAISQRFPGETLIVPTGHEKIRANDTAYRFRPGTDFYYLTGNTEADCVLVMVPQAGGGHRDVLYVEPNPGKTDATFFTNREKGELWVGPRFGVEESRARYAVDEARPLKELDGTLDTLLQGGGEWRVRREADGAIDARLPEQSQRDAELATALSEMRLIKDDFEVTQLEKAIAATRNAFDDILRRLPDLRKEREVEGLFNLRARTDGNDVGYDTIAAAGAHACTLHWTRNDGALRDGELLLIDAGVEAESLYTADITRTFPIGGRFTNEQREVYDLVLAAQRAAFAECKPGNDFLEPNRAAMRVFASGLERMGILRDAEDALKEEHQFYRRYTLHGVSHMLGLDVHDCSEARKENYRHGKLAPGMVLTIEPGLYFQPDDLTVPERYRGIGVRIEDDVLITPDGHRVLSAEIPRDRDAVERWVKRA
ncbi:MAG: aminopeptidase P family protein [Candidatus Eremiobacteraeota bacterium]|nr:aminopeptidase P family protein [Candidatus Eremiobacteraeota bacterium]